MALITAQFGYPAGDSDGALVPVEVSDDKAQIIYRQAVPLGASAVLSFDFQPGRYLVRANLPSGEIAASTVDLTNAPNATALLRSAKRSPRESLGWAYYLQRTPAPSKVARLRNPPTQSIPQLESMVMDDVLKESPTAKFWQHGTPGWTQLSVPDGSYSTGLFTMASYDRSVSNQEPGAQLFIEIQSQLDWQANLGQLWIQVESGNHSRFVAVPPTSIMRIYILDAVPNSEWDAPFRVLVGSGSATLQSLVGFLASGDFDSARSVGTEWFAVAENMSREKLEDAVSAAVAGYFLLGAGEHARLHDWTRNLADWITWLPDGPIIRAFHVLSQKTPDLVEVRGRLLQAVQRGLPLYTQGLRMLFDGLNMMNAQASGQDAELQRALETIRPYAATARWSSPVTSFSAVEPANPQLEQNSIRDYAPAGTAVRVST
jgi:hypothetical protein